MKTKNKILIVDDTEENIDVLVATLEDDYELSVAMDGLTAIDLVNQELPDLILLDIMMPGMDGYEVCRRLKYIEKARDIPVVFLTALNQTKNEARGFAVGAADYMSKPFNPDIVRSRVNNLIQLKLHRDNLELLVSNRTEQLEVMQDVLIKSMAGLAEYRDPETGGHIKRTQKYVKLFANKLKKSDEYKDVLTNEIVELLYKSTALHDIGKVGVPDSILLKPGKLSPEEFDEMKKHTIYGEKILALALDELGEDSFLRYAEEIAYTHHERWDGSGYPRGLSGEDIPISGRIMAIIDVFDALISKRIYKPPFKFGKSIEIIEEGRGIHFDPLLVDILMDSLEEMRAIALANYDFEEEKEALLN